MITPVENRAAAPEPRVFRALPRFNWRVNDEAPVAAFEPRIRIDGRTITVYVADIADAAGVTLTAEADATWTRDTIHGVLDALADVPRVQSFLGWLDNTLNAVEQSLPSLAPPPVVQKPDGRRHRPELFSVGAAAKALDRDPLITIGRDRLFDRMHIAGWIHRPGQVWEPKPMATRMGWLAVADVTEPHFSRTEPYPQVAITVSGLRELQRLLGGITDLDALLATPPHLTLVTPE